MAHGRPTPSCQTAETFSVVLQFTVRNKRIRHNYRRANIPEKTPTRRLYRAKIGVPTSCFFLFRRERIIYERLLNWLDKQQNQRFLFWGVPILLSKNVCLISFQSQVEGLPEMQPWLYIIDENGSKERKKRCRSANSHG